MFYPMGFPVAIETDAPEVVAAAESAWSRYAHVSAGEPVLIRVMVSNRRDTGGETPRVQFDEGRMSITRSSTNYAHANLANGTAEIHLTRDVASDAVYVNYHFLKPLTYLLLAPRHFAFVHASCTALNGHAMILCGGAFAGKTCLAYACARRGWTFLSGDATHLLHDSADFSVVGRPFSIRFRESATALFPELAAFRAIGRPNGKMSIEVETDRLELRTAPSAPASHIVFLERSAAGRARIAPIAADDVLRHLDEAVFFGDAAIRKRQRATLGHFASLPAVRLGYSTPEGAEAALRELQC
ncbi:MAG TPA: hypothetical protein VHC90_02245 [Bryobacteraceae bacterium]|nr:hypothetical protein [Bryobacteraceae bacterium]